MTTTISGTTGVTFPVQAGSTSQIQSSAGKVLQVVQTVKTDSFTTTSAGPVDVTGLSVSITPTSSSSKILVIACVNGSAGINNFYFQLVRASTNIYVGTSGSSNKSAWFYPIGQYVEQYSTVTYLDSPATTTATTYKIQCGQDTGGSTLGINRRSSDTAFGYPCSITVMEIAA